MRLVWTAPAMVIGAGNLRPSTCLKWPTSMPRRLASASSSVQRERSLSSMGKAPIWLKSRQKGRGRLVLDSGVARPITYDVLLDVVLVEDPEIVSAEGCGLCDPDG